MRICAFKHSDVTRIGVIRGSSVVDLVEAGGDPDLYSNAGYLLAAGSTGLQEVSKLIQNATQNSIRPLSSVRLTAPHTPSTTLCSGSNYHAHNAEKANTPLSGKEPEFFLKTADCVIGPEQGIVRDTRLTKKLDCETEIAIVIGKRGRHISEQNALDHVFGYTVANDVTARDQQVRRSPEVFTWYELGRGKAFDTSLPLGPSIVTADEIPDSQNLSLRTHINGELRQSSSTADMIWTCAQLIHFFR